MMALLRLQSITIVAMIIFSHQLLSDARMIETVPIHTQGYCSMYGSNNATSPYVSNTPAVPFNVSSEFGQSLKELCGPLVFNEMLLDERRGHACCSPDQLKTMTKQVQRASIFIASCPACWYNFLGMWCRFTCSPDQSTFLSIEDQAPDASDSSRSIVTGAVMHVSERFVQGFYDSCSEIKMQSANKYALEIIASGAKNGREMVNKFGQIGTGNPILIKFPNESVTMPPGGPQFVNFPAIACNDDDYKCSCIECSQSCAVSVPPLPDPVECKVGDWQCWAFGVIVAYVLVLLGYILLVVGLFALRQFRRQSSAMQTAADSEEAAQLLPHSPQQQSSYSLAEDKLTFSANHSQSAVNSWPVDRWLQRYFTAHGLLMARHPLRICAATLVLVLLMSTGLRWASVETNPIRLWVDPNSEILAQKQYFDRNFEPFYRITQLIVRPKSEYRNLDWQVLNETWRLQQSIEQLQVPVPDAENASKTISLDDLCFKPTRRQCAIQSFTEYYQRQYGQFENDFQLEQFQRCRQQTANLTCFLLQPMDPQLVLGGRRGEDWSTAKSLVITFVLNNPMEDSSTAAAVGYDNNNYNNNNNSSGGDSSSIQRYAVEWERRVVDLLTTKSATFEYITVAFSTESSVEDELSRDTFSDAPTIIFSYLAMFIYASLALGNYRRVRHFPWPLVDSKFALGVGGIVIVIASVTASAGLLSACGLHATLIIAEVIPFLVLAVGVDNIFIIVNAFGRLTANRPMLALEERVALAMGHVGPSILLSSLSETVAFAVGYSVTMPAVSVFSLYAAVAVFINFLLQATCFVALMSLDARRCEADRLDCFPCVKLSSATPGYSINGGDSELAPALAYEEQSNSATKDQLMATDEDYCEERDADCRPLLELLFNNYYAPTLLHPVVRSVVIAVFITMFFWLGLLQTDKLELGLDQRTALPSDSYLIRYFDALESDLEVGPPLYFVIQSPDRSGFDLTDFQTQQLLCAREPLCSDWSIPRVLEIEYQRQLLTGRSTVATPSALWFDDFISYLNGEERPCCVLSGNPADCFEDPYYDGWDSTADVPLKLPWDEEDADPYNHVPSCACWKWRSTDTVSVEGKFPRFNYSLHDALPSDPQRLMLSVRRFLDDIPRAKCPTAGAAAYGNSVKISQDGKRVKSFYARTYHKTLRTQSDFIEAYRDARRIADEISAQTFGIAADYRDPESGLPLVFPYSVFYVFFEQYLTIQQLAITLVLSALFGIGLMITLLLGSPLTALLVVVCVLMMIVNIVGLMALWGVSMNAVSTVNLVIAVGIGVEFCIHVARGAVAFAGETVNGRSAVHRALTELGSSVFSGITLTKFIGITVLAFAHSKIFEIFYFRMYACIVGMGAAHGLVLLPVLLEISGVGRRGPELAKLFSKRRDS